MEKFIQGVKDKIVVKVIQVEEMTSGGIVIPSTAVPREPQLTCSVLSMGKDVTEEISIGSKIYCHQNAGMDILVDKEIIKVLKDDEVYAVVNTKYEGD